MSSYLTESRVVCRVTREFFVNVNRRCVPIIPVDIFYHPRSVELIVSVRKSCHLPCYRQLSRICRFSRFSSARSSLFSSLSLALS